MTRIATKLSVCLLLIFCMSCDRQQNPETSADTSSLDPELSPTGDASAPIAVMDTVNVVLREWTVAPARATLQAGRIVFHVVNEGSYEHALEVEGNGEEKETDHIAPGQTGTLEMDLKPGTYELYCPIDDAHGKHQERGMTTTMTVR